MSQAAAVLPLTYDDYLVAERASTTKHEFVAGEVFAMAGGRLRHNSLSAQVLAALVVQLRDRRCQALGSDMRVRTGDGVAAYPDVTAICGEPTFTDNTEDELLNPSVVVEVLSDSTEAYDRGEKFDHYQTITSLREYVLVSTQRVAVDIFVRQDDGSFVYRHYGLGESITIPSIGCVLSIDELYAKSGLVREST